MDSAEILWGAIEIGEFLGRKPHATQYMLDKGELPGKKVGGRWCVSKRKLVEFLENPGEGSTA